MQSSLSTKQLNTKKLLAVVVVVIALISAVFSLLLYRSINRYRQAIDKESVSEQILVEVFERRLIGDDYLRHPTERAKSQWLIKQEQIVQFVEDNQLKFISSAESNFQQEIKTSLARSSETFNEVTSTYEKIGQQHSDLFDSQKTRLAAELTVNAEATIQAATGLKEINQTAAQTNFNESITLFSVVATIFFVVLFGSFGVIIYSTTKLYNRQAQDAAILSGIGDGVFVIDTEQRIILFNAAATAISGLDERSVLGKPYESVLKFTYEKNGAINNEFINKALGGEVATMNNHTQLTHSRGHKIPVADSAAPFWDAHHKNIAGVVVVFRDITQERALERAKDEFVSLASHQLRTPATAVKQFLGLIVEGLAKDHAEERKFVKQAYDTNEDQLAIVEDILNTAKIDAGRVEIKKEKTDLGALAERLVQQVEGTAKQRAQNLVLNKAPQPVLVMIDKLKMEMVLGNLLSNALKYAPEKGTITLSVNEKDGQACVSVSDTGKGIAEEDLDKLFTKFGRIKNEASENVQGTGLGLYLAKNYTELQGGTLEVESVLHQGTTFVVKLPIGKSGEGA